MLTAALNGCFFSVNEAAQMMTPPHKEMLQPHPPPHALRQRHSAKTPALKQRALPHSAASANVCAAAKRFQPLPAVYKCTLQLIEIIIWPYWWCWFKNAALINVGINKAHICLCSMFITQSYSWNLQKVPTQWCVCLQTQQVHKDLSKEIWNDALKCYSPHSLFKPGSHKII